MTQTHSLLTGPPPFDEAAEQALIGSLMLLPTGVDEVAGLVTPDDCYRETHRAVFATLRQLQAEGIPFAADPLVVLRETQRRFPAACVDTDLLSRLMDAVPDGFHATYYAQQVRDAADRRRVFHACRETLQRVQDASVDPADLLTRLTDLRAGRGGYQLQPMTSAEFLAADFRLSWLVRGVLVDGQPMVIGAPEKTLKTGVVIDLAVSLGSGTPFLNHPGFGVPMPVRVCVLSGESGGAKLRAAAEAVCQTREISLRDCDVLWSLDLPKLADPDHLRGLRRSIESLDIRVLVIDPAYLCLMAGDTQGRAASNVFDTGSILLDLSRLGQQTGCTIIVVHHTRKPEAKSRFSPIGLSDLSMSGFREWARQWLLMNRRCEYQGDGRHELWFDVGGSAGHCGRYVLTVDEGQLDDDFNGREWNCRVEHASEAIARIEQSREQFQQELRDRKRLEKLERLNDAIGAASPGGETKSRLRELAKLDTADIDNLLDDLLDRGAIEACSVAKGRQSYPGYRRASLGESERLGVTRSSDSLLVPPDGSAGGQWVGGSVPPLIGGRSDSDLPRPSSPGVRSFKRDERDSDQPTGFTDDRFLSRSRPADSPGSHPAGRHSGSGADEESVEGVAARLWLRLRGHPTADR